MVATFEQLLQTPAENTRLAPDQIQAYVDALVVDPKYTHKWFGWRRREGAELIESLSVLAKERLPGAVYLAFVESLKAGVGVVPPGSS